MVQGRTFHPNSGLIHSRNDSVLMVTIKLQIVPHSENPEPVTSSNGRRVNDDST